MAARTSAAVIAPICVDILKPAALKQSGQHHSLFCSRKRFSPHSFPQTAQTAFGERNPIIVPPCLFIRIWRNTLQRVRFGYVLILFAHWRRAIGSISVLGNAIDSLIVCKAFVLKLVNQSLAGKGSSYPNRRRLSALLLIPVCTACRPRIQACFRCEAFICKLVDHPV